MNWNQFVVDYKNKHGISFKEALTKAGPEWRKMKGTTSQTVKKSRSKKSRDKKYVCKKISKKSKGHKKGKESPWIAFVKKYAKDHKIEFKDAMKPAGKAWKSQKGQKGGGTHVTSAGEGGSVVSSTPEGSEGKKQEQSAPSTTAPSATATSSEPTGGTPTTEPFAMFGGKKKSKKHRKKKRRGNKSKKH